MLTPPVRRAAPCARLATGLALAACASGATTAPPDAAVVAAALDVTVEPAEPSVAADGRLAVTVRVVNRSARTVAVGGRGSCTVRAEAYDAAGAETEPSRNATCTRDYGRAEFAPGRAYVRVDLFRPSGWSHDQRREVTLPAGEYFVRGVVSGFVEGTDAPVRVSGPAVAVRVR